MKYQELKIRHSPSKGWCVTAFNVEAQEREQISRWYKSYNYLYRYWIEPRKLYWLH